MDKANSSIENLNKKGWTRRFSANEPRLSESVDVYKEAGFDVWLEPLPEKDECETCNIEESDDSCQVCFEGVKDQYKIIFTRPKKD